MEPIPMTVRSPDPSPHPNAIGSIQKSDAAELIRMCRNFATDAFSVAACGVIPLARWIVRSSTMRMAAFTTTPTIMIPTSSPNTVNVVVRSLDGGEHTEICERWLVHEAVCHACGGVLRRTCGAPGETSGVRIGGRQWLPRSGY